MVSMVFSLYKRLLSGKGGKRTAVRLLVPLLFVFTGTVPRLHPFYVSVTEINENRKEQTLEISCKMFTDDLENAINRSGTTQVDLLNPRDSAEVNIRLAGYVRAHLQLTVNGERRTPVFIGFEQEGGAIWSYLQIADINEIKKIAIRNDLLYELFPTQTGILHVTVNKQRKSTRLNNPDRDAVFNF